MSLKLKKALSLMIAIFVAFSMMAVGTSEASAATAKVKVSVNNQIDKNNHIYVGEKAYVVAYATRGTKPVTIKKITVSDKTIAKVMIKTFKVDGKKYKEYYVLGKKPGKTKVTVKYKYNGKVKYKKINVTVEAYPNPLQSLEVNGKNVPLSGVTSFIYEAKCKKTKVKIKAVPSEGWEIIDAMGDISYPKNKPTKYSNIKKVKSKVKKGTVISFPKKYKNMYVSFTMENEEGVAIFYEILLKK